MNLVDALKREKLGPRMIYTTDWHARNRPPVNRIDNYRQALLDKLAWCMDAGDRLGAEKVMLCGGDIFDVPMPNVDMADDIVDLFLMRGWKLATAVGNHDLNGGLSTLSSTLLGHFMRRGLVKLLPTFSLGPEPFCQEPYELGGIQWWAHNYTYGNHVDELRVEGDLSKPLAVISHSMILEKPANFGENEFKLFKDVKTNADLLLLGHYHPQSRITELHNEACTIIAGPGALMRGTLSRDDLARIPAMVLVEHVSRTRILVDYIDIDIAQPARDIFKLEAVAKEKMRAEKLEQFISSLDNLKVQALDAASIVDSVARANNVEEPVRLEALHRLGVL